VVQPPHVRCRRRSGKHLLRAARWPRGSRERVIFDILAYTGLRIGDVAVLGRQHLKQRTIVIDGEPVRRTVPVVPLRFLRKTHRHPNRLRFVQWNSGDDFDLRRDRQIVGQLNVHGVRAVRGGNSLQRIEQAHIFRYSQPVVWPAFFSNEKMSIRLTVGDRVNVDIAAHR
jgi:integrase